jgi:hypothetical protein
MMTISFGVIDGGGFLMIVSTGLCEDLDQLEEYVLAMQRSCGHDTIDRYGPGRVAWLGPTEKPQ